MPEEPTPVTLPTLAYYPSSDMEMEEGADRGDHAPGQEQQGDSALPPTPVGGTPGQQPPPTTPHRTTSAATEMGTSHSFKRGRDLVGDTLAQEANEAESSRRGASTSAGAAEQQTPPGPLQLRETDREAAREAFLAMPLLPTPESWSWRTSQPPSPFSSMALSRQASSYYSPNQ